ncbi:uncharacterized protein LOC120081061 [Benincasa hispida]|uniref:uncharacterized protein LOC120081061 n=1 Tax=Benincasa hispida TaxID=102211 RepID=UPI0018FFA2C8|nr:uncharacterized protein LOC120081061 [Benincasa hispida]
MEQTKEAHEESRDASVTASTSKYHMRVDASLCQVLKDIISKKRKLGNYEAVALTQDCNTAIPPNMQDPRSCTIPCSIGGMALCDLGASINLMPPSIFKKLEIGELTPITVTLQLAYRSLVHPKIKLEHVLVKVDEFILLADFIILDHEADKDVPIILGRPFLSIERT